MEKIFAVFGFSVGVFDIAYAIFRMFNGQEYAGHLALGLIFICLNGIVIGVSYDH